MGGRFKRLGWWLCDTLNQACKVLGTEHTGAYQIATNTNDYDEGRVKNPMLPKTEENQEGHIKAKLSEKSKQKWTYK